MGTAEMIHTNGYLLV